MSNDNKEAVSAEVSNQARPPTWLAETQARRLAAKEKAKSKAVEVLTPDVPVIDAETMNALVLKYMNTYVPSKFSKRYGAKVLEALFASVADAVNEFANATSDWSEENCPWNIWVAQIAQYLQQQRVGPDDLPAHINDLEQVIALYREDSRDPVSLLCFIGSIALFFRDQSQEPKA